jgi:transposase-like protein
MTQVAADLGISPSVLLMWRRAYEAGGEEALNPPGAPRRRPPIGPSLDLRRSDELDRAARRIEQLQRQANAYRQEIRILRSTLKYFFGSQVSASRPELEIFFRSGSRRRGGNNAAQHQPAIQAPEGAGAGFCD